MKTQHLPALPERPETGPMKFGDDWTGVFIRGDNALYLATQLSFLLKDEERTIMNNDLFGLKELLESAAETTW